MNFYGVDHLYLPLVHLSPPMEKCFSNLNLFQFNEYYTTDQYTCSKTRHSVCVCAITAINDALQIEGYHQMNMNSLFSSVLYVYINAYNILFRYFNHTHSNDCLDLV